MDKRYVWSAAIVAGLSLPLGAANAAVSAAEAAKLGKELTPVGAEKAVASNWPRIWTRCVKRLTPSWACS